MNLLRNKFVFGLFCLLPFVLLVLPADFFDSGTSWCLVNHFFGIECWGCGITRAIQHVIHGEIDKAFELNQLVIFVFPVLVFLYLSIIFKQLKFRKLNFSIRE